MNQVDSSIRVGSFNILSPTYALKNKQSEGVYNDGNCNWFVRQERIINLIKDSQLDVICLQEICNSTLQDLSPDVSKAGYELIFKKHPVGHDGLAILFKKGRMDKKNLISGSFQKRTFLFVDFIDKTINKIIRIGNCHLMGGLNEQEGFEQMENLLKDFLPKPKEKIDLRILMGDFASDEKIYRDTKIGKIPSSKFSKLIAHHAQTDFDLNKNDFDPNVGPFDPSQHNSYSLDTIQINSNSIIRAKVDWIFALPSNQESIKMEADSSLFNSQEPIGRSKRASSHHMIATKIIFQNPNQPTPPPPPPLLSTPPSDPSTLLIPPLETISLNPPPPPSPPLTPKDSLTLNLGLSSSPAFLFDSSSLKIIPKTIAYPSLNLSTFPTQIPFTIPSINFPLSQIFLKTDPKKTAIDSPPKTTPPPPEAANVQSSNKKDEKEIKIDHATNPKKTEKNMRKSSFFQSVSTFFRKIGRSIKNLFYKISLAFGNKKKKK